MFVVPILFGLACAVTIWFAAQGADTRAKVLAWGMLAIWASANIAWLLNALWLLPVYDLTIGVMALVMWRRSRTAWLTVFVQAVSARLVFHALDEATDSMYLIAYIHLINAAFAVQLAAVAYSGGANGYRLLREFCDHHRGRKVRSASKAA